MSAIYGNSVGQLISNNESGEGRVVLNQDFLELDEICKLDILADWITALENEYQELGAAKFGTSEVT